MFGFFKKKETKSSKSPDKEYPFVSFAVLGSDDIESTAVAIVHLPSSISEEELVGVQTLCYFLISGNEDIAGMVQEALKHHESPYAKDILWAINSNEQSSLPVVRPSSAF